MNKTAKHKQICEYLTETYKSKNADYGNSFGEMFAELGIITAVTRIGDKFNRIKNLAKKSPQDMQVKSESIKDTLLDMANYCIMTVIEMEKATVNTEELTNFSRNGIECEFCKPLLENPCISVWAQRWHMNPLSMDVSKDGDKIMADFCPKCGRKLGKPNTYGGKF